MTTAKSRKPEICVSGFLFIGHTKVNDNHLNNHMGIFKNNGMKMNESFFGNFFANKQQPKNPLFNHPKLGKAFGSLVQQFGGDEKKAEQELQRLQQSSFGQYQLGRLGSGLTGSGGQQPSQDDAKFNQGWQANKLGGQQMFGNQPGSHQ